MRGHFDSLTSLEHLSSLHSRSSRAHSLLQLAALKNAHAFAPTSWTFDSFAHLSESSMTIILHHLRLTRGWYGPNHFCVVVFFYLHGLVRILSCHCGKHLHIPSSISKPKRKTKQCCGNCLGKFLQSLWLTSPLSGFMVEQYEMIYIQMQI